MLRIHSKTDRNWQKLTVYCACFSTQTAHKLVYCPNIYTVLLGSSGVQAVAALIYKACQRLNKMEANIQSFTQIAKVCGELSYLDYKNNFSYHILYVFGFFNWMAKKEFVKDWVM